MGQQQPRTDRPPAAPDPDPADDPDGPTTAGPAGPTAPTSPTASTAAPPCPAEPAAPAPGVVAGSLGLRPLRHRVDRRAIGWWSTRVILGVAPLVAVLSIGYAVLPAVRGWLGPILLVLVPAWLAHLVVVPSWRYAVHGWEVTPDAVYAVSGWFVREWRAAPISRIQTVDTVRGPLEQLFGLATVTVTTASASGPVVLVGLDADLAARTAGRLTEIVRQTAGDAT
ncbi:PH domain-containing protein [Plantactinospora sp. KLBMP9567]|uniref:PH domain-containing protein n=1 Tax=Plantactinospora sp. KLBMP9567 TaxID=3085900 RepID=UPI0029812DCE|nr:PH domain-containing protein [Plantactinospora sp. KLBMP9567]MDW5323654.1 PH domain-containing protein [Plantactinospora sp. KLBMP9567]